MYELNPVGTISPNFSGISSSHRPPCEPVGPWQSLWPLVLSCKHCLNSTLFFVSPSPFFFCAGPGRACPGLFGLDLYASRTVGLLLYKSRGLWLPAWPLFLSCRFFLPFRFYSNPQIAGLGLPRFLRLLLRFAFLRLRLRPLLTRQPPMTL